MDAVVVTKAALVVFIQHWVNAMVAQCENKARELVFSVPNWRPMLLNQEADLFATVQRQRIENLQTRVETLSSAIDSTGHFAYGVIQAVGRCMDSAVCVLRARFAILLDLLVSCKACSC